MGKENWRNQTGFFFFSLHEGAMKWKMKEIPKYLQICPKRYEGAVVKSSSGRS